MAAKHRFRWSRSSDERLLSLRFSQLGVRLEGSVLEGAVEQVRGELEARGFSFRPHAWLSTDWFSPDGVAGIALPFYLAHPRLIQLESAQVLHAEGTGRAALPLIRHEIGHAVDTAFHLHRRRRWREAFGLRGEPYARTYTADPYSRDFVHNLPRWYAQSHPAEDFAETFAVWLDPGSMWTARYAGRARAKLEAVDELMDAARARRPEHRREQTESLGKLHTTLGEHYAAKRGRFLRRPAPPSSPACAAASHPALP